MSDFNFFSDARTCGVDAIMNCLSDFKDASRKLRKAVLSNQDLIRSNDDYATIANVHGLAVIISQITQDVEQAARRTVECLRPLEEKWKEDRRPSMGPTDE